jgi:hypothetical protein
VVTENPRQFRSSSESSGSEEIAGGGAEGDEEVRRLRGFPAPSEGTRRGGRPRRGSRTAPGDGQTSVAASGRSSGGDGVLFPSRSRERTEEKEREMGKMEEEIQGKSTSSILSPPGQPRRRGVGAGAASARSAREKATARRREGEGARWAGCRGTVHLGPVHSVPFLFF